MASITPSPNTPFLISGPIPGVMEDYTTNVANTTDTGNSTEMLYGNYTRGKGNTYSTVISKQINRIKLYKVRVTRAVQSYETKWYMWS